MINSVSALLKKSKLTGREVGKIVLAAKVNDIENLRSGKYDPLITNEDIQSMVDNLRTQRDADDYLRAARIYNSIGHAYGLLQSYNQQACHGTSSIKGYMKQIVLCAGSAYDSHMQSVESPVVLTRTEYNKRVKAAPAYDDYYPIYNCAIIETLEYYMGMCGNLRPKPSKSMTAAISKLKKMHPTGAVLEWLKQNTGINEYADFLNDDTARASIKEDVISIWAGEQPEPIVSLKQLPKPVEKYSFYELFTHKEYYSNKDGWDLFCYYMAHDIRLSGDDDHYDEMCHLYNERFQEFVDTFPELYECLHQDFISKGIWADGVADCWEYPLPYTVCQLAEQGIQPYKHEVLPRGDRLFPDDERKAAQSYVFGVSIMEDDERAEYEAHKSIRKPTLSYSILVGARNNESVLNALEHIKDVQESLLIPSLRIMVAYNRFFELLANEMQLPMLKKVAEAEDLKTILDDVASSDVMAWVAWHDYPDLREELMNSYSIITEDSLQPTPEREAEVIEALPKLGLTDDLSAIMKLVVTLSKADDTTGGE